MVVDGGIERRIGHNAYTEASARIDRYEGRAGKRVEEAMRRSVKKESREEAMRRSVKKESREESALYLEAEEKRGQRGDLVSAFKASGVKMGVGGVVVGDELRGGETTKFDLFNGGWTPKTIIEVHVDSIQG